MYDWELTDNALKAWIRLRQASEAVERVLGTGLDKHDATLTQIDVLGVLSASKVPLTPGAIGSYTFREQNSVSTQLSRMRKAGLISKTRSRKDQRVVTVRVTPKGEELLEQTRQAGFGQAYELLKSALSDKEIEQLDKLLKKVRDRALQQLRMKAERLPETFDATRFRVALERVTGKGVENMADSIGWSDRDLLRAYSELTRISDEFRKITRTMDQGMWVKFNEMREKEKSVEIAAEAIGIPLPIAQLADDAKRCLIKWDSNWEAVRDCIKGKIDP